MEMSREKGGRPTGTTKKRKHSTNLAIIGAKNEITKKYKRELDNRTHKVRMPKGRLTAIIREVKEKSKLGADIVIAGKTIRQRIGWGLVKGPLGNARTLMIIKNTKTPNSPANKLAW